MSYDPEKVVKCGCGLTMRQRDWAKHWRACERGCSIRITQKDIESLEMHEARLAFIGVEGD